ncbi:transporter [bacterium]|nr:transporter [bacterium]
MLEIFKKHSLGVIVTLALCLGSGKLLAQPPESPKKEEAKADEGDPTFFYRFAQFLVREPDKTFTSPTMRNPGPDTANFPNSPNTLPKGMFYVEVTPFNLAGASSSSPRTYTTPTLIRYGITDDVEFRLFTNGFTAINNPETTGFSPLVFDMKVRFWEEKEGSFLPSMGLEVYLQTDFGSGAFNTGLQPAMSLLFTKDFLWDLTLEANVGFQSSDIGLAGYGDGYELNVQGALTKKVTEKFSVFAQTFYNGAANPRSLDNIIAGGGVIYNLTERTTIWGSYNASLAKDLSPYLAYMGVAFAF